MFPAQIQAGQYKRSKLQDYNGNPVPFCWFNAGRKIAKAYVVSSFGILTFVMRKCTLDGAWLQSSVFQHIMVNLFPLEEIGTNTTPTKRHE
jgi:succinate-acetate transporter protein